MQYSKNHESVVIDFGIRTISNQQCSKVVALPKIALSNLSDREFSKVSIKLIHQQGEKFLKVTPSFPKEKTKDE